MIQDIISQITAAGGLSRPNKFSVQITPPAITQQLMNVNANIPDYFKAVGVTGVDMPSRLDFMCIRTELPGKSFGASDIRTYGSTFQMPHIDVYSNITLNFIVGRDMIERHFFDAWLYTIQDPDTADFNYVNEYGTTVDIFQLDEYDNANYGVRLFQAWPITIGELHLDYGEMNSFHVLPITFTYRKWINTRINTATPTTIQNGGPAANFNNTIYQGAKS